MQRKPAPLKGNGQSRYVEKLPKCWIFGELACLGAFLRGVSAMLVTRRLEIEAPILVLLTVLRAGVHVMTLNGKSRINKFVETTAWFWYYRA
jgi:hypothetical protein